MSRAHSSFYVYITPNPKSPFYALLTNFPFSSHVHIDSQTQFFAVFPSMCTQKPSQNAISVYT